MAKVKVGAGDGLKFDVCELTEEIKSLHRAGNKYSEIVRQVLALEKTTKCVKLNVTAMDTKERRRVVNGVSLQVKKAGKRLGHCEQSGILYLFVRRVCGA